MANFNLAERQKTSENSLFANRHHDKPHFWGGQIRYFYFVVKGKAVRKPKQMRDLCNLDVLDRRKEVKSLSDYKFSFAI